MCATLWYVVVCQMTSQTKTVIYFPVFTLVYITAGQCPGWRSVVKGVVCRRQDSDSSSHNTWRCHHKHVFFSECHNILMWTHSKESTPPANICRWLRVVMDVVRWRLAWSNCFMSLVISLTCAGKGKVRQVGQLGREEARKGEQI